MKQIIYANNQSFRFAVAVVNLTYFFKKSRVNKRKLIFKITQKKKNSKIYKTENKMQFRDLILKTEFQYKK